MNRRRVRTAFLLLAAICLSGCLKEAHSETSGTENVPETPAVSADNAVSGNTSGYTGVTYDFPGTGTLWLIPAVPEALVSGTVPGEDARVLGLSPDGKTALCVVRETVEKAAQERETSETETVSPTVSNTLAGRKKQNEQPKNTDKPESETETVSPAVSNTLAGRKKTSGEAKTVTVYRLCILRDGKTIPVQANAARGDGDPYGVLDEIISAGQLLPGREGLSWSADGRYVTFSDVLRVTAGSGTGSLNVPIVDTAAGEIYLVNSYNRRNILIDGGGWIYLTAMSRSGEYVYWVGMVNDAHFDGPFCFCRSTPDGKTTEFLCEIPAEDDDPYLPLSSSRLAEAPDGSWLMTGMTRTQSNGFALIRFAPSGNAWTAEAHPVSPAPDPYPERMYCSAVSGYGIIVLRDRESTNFAEAASIETSNRLKQYKRRVQLMRILPDDDVSYDVWNLEQTGENDTDVEMVSAEEIMTYMLALYAGENPEEPETDPDRMKKYYPLIVDASLSPDGRYALLLAYCRGWKSNWQLFLTDMENMSLRPVNVFGGTVSLEEAAYSLTKGPGAVWNPDGTLILYINTDRFYFRLEEW